MRPESHWREAQVHAAGQQFYWTSPTVGRPFVPGMQWMPGGFLDRGIERAALGPAVRRPLLLMCHVRWCLSTWAVQVCRHVSTHTPVCTRLLPPSCCRPHPVPG